MLIDEQNVFCQDDTDIGCSNDLQMKIKLSDDRPVAKNYVGVSPSFDRGIETVCRGSSE